MQNPWSSYPGYTYVQVEEFKRAGEKAVMVKGSLNFARFGLETLTAYALWVHGWGVINPSTNASVVQQDEYDLDLQWRPRSEFQKGFWFRARYAHVASRSGNGGIPHRRSAFHRQLRFSFALRNKSGGHHNMIKGM